MCSKAKLKQLKWWRSIEDRAPRNLQKRSLYPLIHVRTLQILIFCLDKLKGMMKIYNNAIPNWIVTPTFWCATNLLTFLLMICCALSYFFYFEAHALNELEIRYDDKCEALRAQEKACIIEFELENDLNNPKLYYRLDNFYINHRSFAKSREWK